MPDVHLIADLPDGTAIGADDDGAIYRGQRTQLGHDELRVETVVDKDGESFTRTTYQPDGTVFGHGVTTREGFERVARITAALDGADVDEDALAAKWEAEKVNAPHQPSATPASVIIWTKE